MNSRLLWNSHQRYKLLRADASRDILKIRVSRMAFPAVLKNMTVIKYGLDWIGKTWTGLIKHGVI